MPKIAAATVAEHKARTWDLLLDAMDGLVLERPFESITMRDVASRAGVARTAIYNYAPDTVTLLTEATRRGSARVREVVALRADDTSVPPSQRLRSIVTVLLVEHARSTGVLLAGQALERSLGRAEFSEAVLPLRDEIGDRIVDVVRAGVEAGEFTDVADPALTRALMVGVMQAALARVSGPSANSREVAEVAAQFLINALSGPAHRGHQPSQGSATGRP